MERRDQVKEEENTATAELIQDLRRPGVWELSEDADVIHLPVVDSETNTARFVGFDDHRARARRGRALHEASRKISVQSNAHSFGHDRIHVVGARGHWWAARRDRNLERQETTRAKLGR